MTTAREALYDALMTGSIPGTGHTPDRSTQATQLIEALINSTLTTAANKAYDIGDTMRENDGTYPEEWSSRDVRDAVHDAADAILKLKGTT
jgi:hypothetical protein